MSAFINNSPMPYSVFFYKGYAIHGTTELHRLGGPASCGCIRATRDTLHTCARARRGANAHLDLSPIRLVSFR
jgi:hypothetical protein